MTIDCGDIAETVKITIFFLTVLLVVAEKAFVYHVGAPKLAGAEESINKLDL